MSKNGEYKMRKIKIGIIGLGYIGRIHLRHGLELPNIEVSGVADLSRKALKMARNLGVEKRYSNYVDLLKDPEIEAVLIGLPTHLHLRCTRDAAEAGKHVFLEKPIARNVKEAKEVISVTQKNSVKLMIGYPMRFNTAFRGIKKKMADGTLGDVENAHATYVSLGPFSHRVEVSRDQGHIPTPVPDWWFKKELTGGGALIDLGSHIINLLRWYFGEITDIKGYFGHRFNMDFEDSAMCLAKFDSGTVAVINVGWYSQEYRLSIELLGTVSHERVLNSPPNPLVTAVQMLATGRSRFYQPHLDELQYFTNCLINDLTPSPSGQDGLNDIAAICKAYEHRVELEDLI